MESIRGGSRSRTAELIRVLNKDAEMAPSVIGIDLDYSLRKDTDGDKELVAVCNQYKNVCMSASVVMEDGTVMQSLFSAAEGVAPDADGEPDSGHIGRNMIGGQEISYIRMPFKCANIGAKSPRLSLPAVCTIFSLILFPSNFFLLFDNLIFL